MFLTFKKSYASTFYIEDVKIGMKKLFTNWLTCQPTTTLFSDIMTSACILILANALITPNDISFDYYYSLS